MGKSGKGGKGGGGGGAALLTPEGDLSAAFQAVLGDVFRRFDADADGALDDAELNAFAAACNDGAPFAAEELEEIKARARKAARGRSRRACTCGCCACVHAAQRADAAAARALPAARAAVHAGLR